jgi:sulfoxide reductase heme-binding subunit YedZ
MTIAWPWNDRSGRFSALKALVLFGALLPALVLVGQGFADDLGARPLKAAILYCGEWTIRFLLITLALTPARVLFAWPRLALVRRMVGVTAMAYGLLHLTLYAVEQNLRWMSVASEIATKIYLTIGFAALCGLVALGVTSTDGWLRRLRRRWKQLHRIVYVIAALGTLHYFMQAKANVSPAVLVAGFYVWLMLWRVLPARRQRHFPVLLALAIVSMFATAFLEAGWYAVATGIDARRVLAANLHFAIGLRPAIWVGIVATCVAMATLARHLIARSGLPPHGLAPQTRSRVRQGVSV